MSAESLKKKNGNQSVCLNNPDYTEPLIPG
jgi:hypothetical protein